MSPFEIAMLLLFGASWPVSIAKALRTKVVAGKSPVFMVIVIIVVKVMPTVLEFQSIRKAVIKVARESGDSVVSIQQGFDKISAIDDITSISGRDLLIEKRDGAFVVSFQYEKRIPLVGPASLVLDYRGSSRDK